MNKETRRFLDSVITKNFLTDNDNRRFVTELATEFSKILNKKLEETNYSSFINSNFYLKGGNSIAVLTGEEPTGDFDFQFAPPKSVYQNWNKHFQKLDELILSSLRQTLINFNAGNPKAKFNDQIFKPENIMSSAITENPTFNEISLTKGKQRISERHIGKNHCGQQTYFNIINDPAYNAEEGRIELDENETVELELKINCGMSIYVNYSIPGFILYRLVRSYLYNEDGEEADIPLKSEIIDISVPRPGSGENLLSQDGVITRFRLKNGFKIPGWGYHFYENINLLQEIELGISGSKDKKDKRIKRLRQSIRNLWKVNRSNEKATLCGEKICEEYDEFTTSEICGFSGVLVYHINDYKDFHTEEVYPTDAMKALNSHMMKEVQQHLVTVAASVNTNLVNTLSQYLLNKNNSEKKFTVSHDNNCNNPDPYSTALITLFSSYNVKKSRDPQKLDPDKAIAEVKKIINIVLDDSQTKQYRFIAPFDIMKNSLLLSTNFSVVWITPIKWSKLKSEVKKTEKVIFEDTNTFIITLSVTGGVLYAVFTNQEKCGAKIEEMLQKSILISQRKQFTEIIQNNR